MKIVVTGDIHIGKRSTAIDDNAPELSSKYTWEQLVGYCLDNPVDLLLLTGDIVDRDNRFFEALSPLQKGLKRLNEHGIPVYMVAGNHDYDVLPEIVRVEAIPNLFLLGENGGWESRIFQKKGHEIQLIGWSFPGQFHTVDPVGELPAGLIREDIPTLALVHGDLYTQRGKYAPMSLSRLKEHSHVEAWLLGHIHKPCILHEQPLILYPGSPHALHPKETGEHGPYILYVEEGKIRTEQLPFSPVRYEWVRIDISSVTDKESYRRHLYASLREYASRIGGRHLKYVVYDLELTGEYNDPRELKQWETELLDYNGNESFEEKIRTVVYQVSPRIKAEDFVHDPSYMGVLAQSILLLERGETNDFIRRLQKQWKDKYEIMTQANIYAQLARVEGEELTWKMNDFLLKECKRLFTELYNQRMK